MGGVICMSKKKNSVRSRVKFLLNLPRSLPLAWKLIKDSRLPLQNKLIFVGVSIIYLVLPVDIIPDIPLLGQLDDFTIFMILFNWFLNKAPLEIKEEYGWK